jgi:hypothetical protein
MDMDKKTTEEISKMVAIVEWLAWADGLVEKDEALKIKLHQGLVSGRLAFDLSELPAEKRGPVRKMIESIRNGSHPGLTDPNWKPKADGPDPGLPWIKTELNFGAIGPRGNGTMKPSEMLAKAERVEVAIVLFREDFLALAMKPELDPAMKDLDECWRIEPKPGWTVTTDDEDNMTALATEPFEPPAGWRWVATMALVLIPNPGGPPGMCFGLGTWFAMAGVNPTPRMEAFLDFFERRNDVAGGGQGLRGCPAGDELMRRMPAAWLQPGRLRAECPGAAAGL